MNCAEAMKRLPDYVDGELGWFESLRIRRHLLRCEACAKQFRLAMALDAKVTTALKERVESPDLSLAIMAALPDRPVKAHRRGRGRLIQALAYGLIGLSVGVGAVLYYSSPQVVSRTQVADVTKPAPKSQRVQPKPVAPVTEQHCAIASEPPIPHKVKIGRVAGVGVSTKAVSKHQPLNPNPQISVFSVTVSGRPRSDEDPAAVANVTIMGRPVEFDEGSRGVVERHLAENHENSDVERSPLESVVKPDPIADRIRAKM